MTETTEPAGAAPAPEPSATPDRLPTTGQATTAHRALAAPATVDRAALMVEVVWSTGARARNYVPALGLITEELDMSPNAVRMDGLRSGQAPVLNTHGRGDARDVLGRITTARLERGRGYATLQFSAAADVEPVWQRIADGTLRAVSFGYRMHRYEPRPDVATGETVHRAVDWEPFEISVVPIPVDRDAAVRGQGDQGVPVTAAELHPAGQQPGHCRPLCWRRSRRPGRAGRRAVRRRRHRRRAERHESTRQTKRRQAVALPAAQRMPGRDPGQRAEVTLPRRQQPGIDRHGGACRIEGAELDLQIGIVGRRLGGVDQGEQLVRVAGRGVAHGGAQRIEHLRVRGIDPALPCEVGPKRLALALGERCDEVAAMRSTGQREPLGVAPREDDGHGLLHQNCARKTGLSAPSS